MAPQTIARPIRQQSSPGRPRKKQSFPSGCSHLKSVITRKQSSNTIKSRKFSAVREKGELSSKPAPETKKPTDGKLSDFGGFVKG